MDTIGFKDAKNGKHGKHGYAIFLNNKKREAIVCKIKDLYKNIFEQKKKE